MHTVFVLPRFYPYRGGYENSILTLAKFLVARGHRATVFTTTADDLEALWLPGFKTFPQEQFSIDGVMVRRFAIDHNTLRRRATRLLGLAPYWRWKAEYWRPSFRVIGLNEALRAVDADLIHVGPLPHNSLLYAGLRAGEQRGIPVVATPCVHLGETGNDSVSKQYLQPHQLELLRHCDKIFCMTATEHRHLHVLGLPDAELAVAPHGTDVQNAIGGDPWFLQQKYGVDGPVVLHLGMKAYPKGSETLVEAMKLLWSRGSEDSDKSRRLPGRGEGSHAWLVLAGPRLSAFDTFIASAGKNCPRLLNLPPFADEEKRDLLASATIVAQPSSVESLGHVLIEAWANRKPVVAADIEVSRELVSSSRGGVTVPFGDVQKLAQELDRLLHDPTAREQMGNSGYHKAMEYAGDAPWKRFVDEFEHLTRC